MHAQTETNGCAILTPTGRGAVAVIGVFGPNVRNQLEPLFQSASGKRLSSTSEQKIFYGHWLSTGEDVVIYCEQGQPLEIHCHGGQTAPAAIIKSLTNSGFQELSPTEVAQYVHAGRWPAEVAMELANGRTEITATILGQQLEMLGSRQSSLRQRINTNPAGAIEEIETMLQWDDFGRYLTQPRTVVMCGKPNVGKSSLVNAIVGFNRAIVHATPGTTRDVVAQMTAINGWPIKLTDTAGLRSAQNEIERIGVSRSETEIERADLVVLVVAANAPITAADRKLAKRIQPDLIVENKSDLIQSPNIGVVEGDRDLTNATQLLTSTKTGDGMPELVQAIGDLLTPTKLPQNILIPINSRQIELLRTLLMLLNEGDCKTAETLLADEFGSDTRRD